MSIAQRVVARLKETSAEGKGDILRGKWYLVDVSKPKDTIVAGPFGDSQEAEAYKRSKGWDDESSGAISHDAMRGADCIANGVKWDPKSWADK